MNTFKCKKIRQKSKRKPLSEKAKQNIITALGILLLIMFIYYGSLQLLAKFSGSGLVQFFSELFGKELMVDERGRTNILLLGVGGEGHEGANLTDTMLVASLNHNDKSASMLSVPRDLYVESSLGGRRINSLYENGIIKWDSEISLDFVRTTVSDIFGIRIQYVAKIDFAAFAEIVDSVGGIDVYVDETIDDKEYPVDKTYEMEPFYLEQGQRHLDGETALKYVRSRKSTSDFDRSKRQQKALIALKNKAQEKNMFSQRSLLKKLYFSLNKHVETNMSLREMLSLTEFGMAWNAEKLNSLTLSDDPNLHGGLLYTPLRELYGGAFVLLPAGDNFDAIKNFVELNFYGPVGIAETPLVILNGTPENGLAGTASSAFHRLGINIEKIGNADSKDKLLTTWYVNKPEAQPLTDSLNKILPGKISSTIPAQYLAEPEYANAKIFLELGADSVQNVGKLDIFNNVVELVPTETALPSPTVPAVN